MRQGAATITMRVGRANGGQWLRLAEAAAALGVSHNTLRRWSDDGRVRSYRSPGGHRRYRRADIEAALGRSAHAAEPAGSRSGEDDAGRISQISALQALASVAAEGVAVTSCCIALCDGDDTLRIVAAHPPDGHGRTAGAHLPRESSATEAEVLRSRRRLVVPDLAATSLLAPPVAEDYLRQGVRALLVLPITVAGRSLGVLRLADTRGPHDFTAAMVTFAESVAGHAGLLIAGGGETSRLGQPAPEAQEPCEIPATDAAGSGADGPKQGSAADSTQQGASAVSTSAVPSTGDPARIERLRRGLSALTEEGLEDTVRLGPETVLRAVVQRLAAVTGAPVAEVYAVEGETCRALTSYDGDQFDGDWEDVVLPLARYPASRRAVESGEVILIADLADPLLDDEVRFSLEKWGYQSQVTLPLFSAGKVIGLVELCDYVPHDFAADLDLIRALARVAGHALETGLFTEQVARRGRVIDELVQIGEIAGRAPGLDVLVRQTAERLQSALDAAGCDIFRVSDHGMRCVASYDRSGFDEHPVGALLDLERHPTVVQAMNAHQVFMVSEIDDPRLSEAERLAYRELGYASEVCVSVVLRDRLHGFIDVYDTRPRDYTDSLGLLRGAGHLLAAAFENARLEERLKRQAPYAMRNEQR